MGRFFVRLKVPAITDPLKKFSYTVCVNAWGRTRTDLGRMESFVKILLNLHTDLPCYILFRLSVDGVVLEFDGDKGGVIFEHLDLLINVHSGGFELGE